MKKQIGEFARTRMNMLETLRESLLSPKYWWVNHKQTYKQEIDGGYLWSPYRESNGARSHFYDNMRRASPGDLILSFANAQISHFGYVIDYSLAAAKPTEFGSIGLTWADDGWLLPVSWHPLPSAVRPKDFIDEIATFLPSKYSPLSSKSGNGHQKAYLSQIDSTIFGIVIQKVGVSTHELSLRSPNDLALNSYGEALDLKLEASLQGLEDLSWSERQQTIQARKGQGTFRENVMQVERRCRVTGIQNPRLLIASHIKPWRSCRTSAERLDGYNGLLLAPHVDFLFDRGLISFSQNGNLLVSSQLRNEDLVALGIKNLPIETMPFTEAQQHYLSYHHSYVHIP